MIGRYFLILNCVLFLFMFQSMFMFVILGVAKRTIMYI